MEISHDEETDDSGNDTGELYFFVGRYAVCEIMGNRDIPDYHRAAGEKNYETEDKPTNTKSPIHVLIIAEAGLGCKFRGFCIFVI